MTGRYFNNGKCEDLYLLIKMTCKTRLAAFPSNNFQSPILLEPNEDVSKNIICLPRMEPKVKKMI